MIDGEKVTKGLEICIDIEPGEYGCYKCPYETDGNCCEINLAKDALAMIKEQAAEIRQLRLALDIAKGTCKGIKSGGGQFADMPTTQSAT